MSELAPGIFTTGYAQRGTAYVMNPRAITGTEAPVRGLAIHPDDWEALPPASREQMLDAVTRGDAARGLLALQRFLADFPMEGR